MGKTCTLTHASIANATTGTYDHHDHETMKTNSTVQLLDAPSDATRGEVWH